MLYCGFLWLSLKEEQLFWFILIRQPWCALSLHLEPTLAALYALSLVRGTRRMCRSGGLTGVLAGGELDLQPSCLSALLSLAWGLGAALVPQTTCPLPGRKGKGARSFPFPQGWGTVRDFRSHWSGLH